MLSSSLVGQRRFHGLTTKECELAAKDDSRDPRLSVSPKPTVLAELNEMTENSDLTKNEIINVAIDVLYFVWSALRQGAVIGVKGLGEKDFQPYHIFSPGFLPRPDAATPTD